MVMNRTIPWKVRGALILVLLVVACSDGGPEATTPTWEDRTVHWTPEGIRHDGGDGSAPSWAFDASIEANNKLTRHGMQIGLGLKQAGFALERIVIRTEEAHPLLGIAAERMVEELAKVPGVQWIWCPAADSPPQVGGLRPDLEIALRLDGAVRPTQDQGRVRIEAYAECRAANNPGSWMVARNDPVLPWNTTYTLEHRSLTTLSKSVGRSAPLMRMAGVNMGEQFGVAIAKAITELRDENGPPPEMPEPLRRSYEPTPPVDWPAELPFKLIASYHGDAVANMTTWTLSTTLAKREVMASLTDAMTAQGWAKARGSSDNNLRMRRGDDELNIEASVARTPITPDRLKAEGRQAVDEGLEGAAQTTRPPIIFTAGFLRQTPTTDLTEQIKGLEFSNEQLPWLLSQASLLDTVTEKRLIAALGSPPAGGWRTCLQIALMQEGHGDKEGADRSTRRARTLAWIANQHGALKRQWIGFRDTPESTPTAQDLADCGAATLTPGAVLERVLGVHESVLVMDADDSGRVRAVRRVSVGPGLVLTGLTRTAGGSSRRIQGGPPIAANLMIDLEGSRIRLSAALVTDTDGPRRCRVKLWVADR